ncbi:DUF6236 family protein [Pseudomonas helleri]|uniref:DUF6236 family protein n=2 Tax=Pseudomonas helleri TaxID=1608996 RepID=UPI003FD01A94
MGESKRRKESDPGYGLRPKGGRGIMIIPDFYEEGTTSRTVCAPSQLRAEQVRFGLCFWDRIAWPSIYPLSNYDDTDMDFLSSAGVLLRPEAKLVPNLTSPGKGLAESYFMAYQELEKKEPGRWSLSASAECDIKFFLGDHIAPDRGITVSLHRAVPIPTRDVMLHDLLEFKLKREPELLALRAEIDNCKQLITSSIDRAEAFATQRDRIDTACTDLLVVSRERKMPVSISDVSMAFEFNGSAAIALAAATAAFSDKFELTGVQTLLTSVGLIAASGIKLTTTFGSGRRKEKLQNSPFRYVHYLHEEIDWL